MVEDVDMVLRVLPVLEKDSRLMPSTVRGGLGFRRLWCSGTSYTPSLSSGLATSRWSLLVLPETGRPGDVVGIVVLGAHGWARLGAGWVGTRVSPWGQLSSSGGVPLYLGCRSFPRGLVPVGGMS